MAYASSPLMPAIDRRKFDIHWRNVFKEEHLISQLGPRQCYQPSASALARRRTNFVPATKTSRTYFSDTAAPERNINETLDTTTTTTAANTTDRIGPRRTDFRQRPQQPRIQPATTLTNIRRSIYQDIRNFLFGTTVAVPTTHVAQTATDETIAPIDNIFSRLRALRNRLEPPRSQVTQDTAKEATTPTVNTFSSHRAFRNRFQHPRSQETQAHMEEPTTSTVSTFSRLRALRNRFERARTQASTTSTETRRFFPGLYSPS
jgi:hypothetical protein